jgi:transcriptional regulator with XRE-family HTH domain
VDPILIAWGQIIRDRRTELGLSYDQLAEMVGVRPPTIFRWEKGQMEPTRPNRIRLAQALQTDVASLFPLGVAS